MFTIEKKKFDIFLNNYKKGKYGSQRLGQAFYNEFKLHRIRDQASLNNLYAKDGEHAINSIKQFFYFT